MLLLLLMLSVIIYDVIIIAFVDNSRVVSLLFAVVHSLHKNIFPGLDYWGVGGSYPYFFINVIQFQRLSVSH